MLRQARDGICCDPARGERRRRDSRGHAGKQFERFTLFHREQTTIVGVGGGHLRDRFEPGGGGRGGGRCAPGGGNRGAARLFVRVGAPATRHRRQQGRNRVSDAGGVILG